LGGLLENDERFGDRSECNKNAAAEDPVMVWQFANDRPMPESFRFPQPFLPLHNNFAIEPFAGLLFIILPPNLPNQQKGLLSG
jgi:hypothetical protein